MAHQPRSYSPIPTMINHERSRASLNDHPTLQPRGYPTNAIIFYPTVSSRHCSRTLASLPPRQLARSECLALTHSHEPSTSNTSRPNDVPMPGYDSCAQRVRHSIQRLVGLSGSNDADTGCRTSEPSVRCLERWLPNNTFLIVVVVVTIIRIQERHLTILRVIGQEGVYVWTFRHRHIMMLMSCIVVSTSDPVFAQLIDEIRQRKERKRKREHDPNDKTDNHPGALSIKHEPMATTSEPLLPPPPTPPSSSSASSVTSSTELLTPSTQPFVQSEAPQPPSLDPGLNRALRQQSTIRAALDVPAPWRCGSYPPQPAI